MQHIGLVGLILGALKTYNKFKVPYQIHTQ